MPNAVQNAVGTQRQFTKQPVATYQKQLHTFSSGVRARDASAAQQLAGALNGLGGVINTYFYDRENRKRTEALDAKRIGTQVTEDEWKTLAANELLTKYGSQFKLADNPYAVSLIEQMRGKYFSDKFNNEYALEVAQNGRMKTTQEEVARYEKMKREFYDSNIDIPLNVQEFDKGFWDSNPDDVLNNANAQVDEQSKALGAVRDGQIQAQAGSLIVESNGDAAKLVDGFTELQKTSIYTQMPDDRRIAFSKDFFLQLAKTYGSADLITAMGEIQFSAVDGTKLKDVIDLEPYKEAAREVNAHYPNQWTTEQYTSMLKCEKVEDLDKIWAAYTPDQQKTMKSFYTPIKQQLIQNEIANQRRMVQQVANEQKLKDYNLSIDNAWATVKSGRAGATSVSQIGKGVTKEMVANRLQGELYSYGNIQDDKDRARAVMNLLSWAPASNLADQIGQKWDRALKGQTADAMSDNADGLGITTAVSCYQANPTLFSATFGDKLGEDISAIYAFTKMTGDVQSGMEKFIQGRDALQNGDIREKLRTESSDTVKTASVTMYDMDTDGTIDMPADNEMLIGMTKSAYMYLRAAGYSESDAWGQVQSALGDTYASYDNHIYPKALFAPTVWSPDEATLQQNGIASNNPMGAFKEWADYVRNSIPGYAPENVELYYNPINNTVQIRTGDGQFHESPMTFPAIWNRVNTYINSPSLNPQTPSFMSNEDAAIGDKGILAQEEILGD